MRPCWLAVAALLVPSGCTIDLVLGSGEGGADPSTTSGGGQGAGGAGGSGGAASCGDVGEPCCAGDTCDGTSLRCDAGTCRGCASELVSGHASNVACVRTASDTTYCWGDNLGLQLSCLAPLTSSAPTEIPHLGAARVVAAAAHTCALQAPDTAYCWGTNGSGQSGVSPTGPGDLVCPGETIPMPGPIGQLVVSKLTSFVRLSNGEVYGWGDNSVGQLAISGAADADPHPDPILLDWTPTATAIAAANSATCVIGLDAKLTCAGSNARRELGTSATLPDGSVNTLGLSNVSRVAASTQGFCALDAQGDVWCWGRNDTGLLGNDGPDDVPTRIVLPAPAKALSVGGAHACAILLDDGVACWGDNAAGALGGCTGDARPGVLRVYLDAAQQTPLRAKSLALGAYASCAIDLDDRVLCWGANDVLQTGSAEGGDVVCGPRPVAFSCE